MGKILVFGDSISYGKWDTEGGWVQRLRKFIDAEYNSTKGGNCQVYNLGIPGEVAIRMVKRFENELLQRITNGPGNIILIAIGINDSCPSNWMVGKQTPEKDFKDALIEMVTIAQKHQCKIAFIGLTPVDLEKSNLQSFSNDQIAAYDTYISEVAKKLSLPKLSMFQELKNSDYLKTIVDDAHPNDVGHEIIFERVKIFLKETYGI